MTVSNNGYCSAATRLNGGSAASMVLAAQPQHGRVQTSEASTNPSFRYYPAPGYEGPDAFTIQTGSGGTVTADFTVTVAKP